MKMCSFVKDLPSLLTQTRPCKKMNRRQNVVFTSFATTETNNNLISATKTPQVDAIVWLRV